MTIREKLQHRFTQTQSLVCVGLDSDIAKLPARFLGMAQPQFEFNKWIIDQTHDLVLAYKPNAAFYEARGAVGWQELQLTLDYLHEHHSDVVTIFDAKRADIGSTNEGYVQAYFDVLGFDAVTVHPYLGQEALQPFLQRKDKGVIVLCQTSNPGAGELQSLLVTTEGTSIPLWQHVAQVVATEWNTHDNCLLVVGATYPEQLAQVRQVVGQRMWLLVPGVGAQGGQVSDLVGGLTRQKAGLIVNSSRGIIFAANPREAATKLRSELQALSN